MRQYTEILLWKKYFCLVCKLALQSFVTTSLAKKSGSFCVKIFLRKLELFYHGIEMELSHSKKMGFLDSKIDNTLEAALGYFFQLLWNLRNAKRGK